MAENRLAILCAGLAVSAYFTAHGATRLAALAWFEHPDKLPLEVAADGATRAESAEPPQRVVQRVLARNVFDSQTGPLWPPAEVAATEVVASGDVEPDEDDAPPACDSKLRLIGTIHYVRWPERSLATLRLGGDVELMRPGMLADGHRLSSVHADTVQLVREEDSVLCELGLFDAEPRPTPAKAKPEVKNRAKARRNALSKRRNAGLDPEEIDRHVQRINDHLYRVDRAFVDRLVSKQASLMGVAKVRPIRTQGKTKGAMLSGFRTDNLLGKLGMRPGDVLRTINGYDMGSPDTALEAYVTLKQADTLTMSILRRGKPVTIEYQIQ